MGPAFVPDAGDLVWLDFDPQVGHEQKGKRPALVVSPARYNAIVGLMLCCPITSRSKGYSFEVDVETEQISGVVIADQVRSIDWRARAAKKAGKASSSVLLETKQKLKALLELG